MSMLTLRKFIYYIIEEVKLAPLTYPLMAHFTHYNIISVPHFFSGSCTFLIL